MTPEYRNEILRQTQDDTLMNLRIPYLVITLTLAAGLFQPASAEDEDSRSDSEKFTEDRYVVILGSYKDFHEAKRKAEGIARSSKVPFSMQGMIYDKKRGLILPDDDSDPTYAGSYIHRRFNTGASDLDVDTEFISIERSEAYDGFNPDYYIIVGGIYPTAKEAAKSVKRFSKTAPEAYSKKTRIYLGCIH